MRKPYYWPYMAIDVYNYAEPCQSYRKHRKTATRQHLLQLFSAKGILKWVAMDILGPSPNVKNGNQHIVVITDRFWKFIRAIQTKKTTVTDHAQIFVNHWVISNWIPERLLTDNGSQCHGKFFIATSVALGKDLMTTIAYQSQINVQTERNI